MFDRVKKFQMLIFKNRYAVTGKNVEVTFEHMYNQFKNNVTRTAETELEYKKSSKPTRDNIKDVGAYIMGTSRENSRNKSNIINRNMVTLDLDYCPEDMLDILENKSDLGDLDFVYFVYSTHSHTTEEPRLRIVIPMDKEVGPEEYDAIALSCCTKIGIEYFDATTTQANRIMYYPSCSSDANYICNLYNETSEFLNVDNVLEEYFDIKNIDTWQRPLYFEGKKRDKLESNNSNDSTKTKYRLVNCFNIEYSITRAIDTFLSDIYKEETKTRYTYIGGASTGGLHIINEQYAFSFHATDEAQGRLLNAFDIVRIHMFGKYDQETEEKIRDTYNVSASYDMMCKYITENLPNVVAHTPAVKEAKQMIINNLEKQGIVETTSGEVSTEEDVNEWFNNLYLNDKGAIKKLPYNITLIVENDPAFKNLFFYDVIKQETCFEKAPYWDKDIKKGDGFRSIDLDHVIQHISSPPYFLTGKENIVSAIVTNAYKKRINYPKYFLSTLPEWDGEKRVETIFCKLFGVKENSFIREASKKWFTALIARIMKPGCKFDMVIALLGAVGIGKSTWAKSLIAVDWDGKMDNLESSQHFFSDIELNFKNMRDTIDGVRGNCIIEIAEFDKHFKSTDKATLKSFISQPVDAFIERYGTRTIKVPRSFVFLASSNEMKPIKNPEDERRFLPFYCTLPKNKPLIFDEKYWNIDIRDQILAEAMELYHSGYQFSAPFAQAEQEIMDNLIETASTENDFYGMIKDYVENKFPTNYMELEEYDMKTEWRNNSGKEQVYRKYRFEFCQKEIATILLGERIAKKLDWYAIKDIDQSLRNLGFVKVDNKRKNFGIFGTQYYYIKKGLENEVDESFVANEINKLEATKRSDYEEKYLKELKEKYDDIILPF